VTRVGAWAVAFSVTLAVELAVAGRVLRPSAPSKTERYGAIAVANLATHPLVWFVIPVLGGGYAGSLVLSEVQAVVVEALVYALVAPRVPSSRAIAASALANAASYLVGLALPLWPAFARALS
jgi:hypothetical protein